MRTASVKDAVAMIPDSAILMVGGFMGVGTKQNSCCLTKFLKCNSDDHSQ